MKKTKSYMVGYTALSFLIQVRPHLSPKVNFVKVLLNFQLLLIN